jgi:hypothetical protein
VQNAVLAGAAVPVQAGGGAPSQAEAGQPASLVKIEAVHGQQALVNLIGYLNEQDLQITSLEILEPNLESVFLHLTGKKLRE